MTPQEWLTAYRKIGNTIISEGKWSAEVVAEKRSINQLAKDRVKEGIATEQEDYLTGNIGIHVEKSAKPLAQSVFFEQIETLLELYQSATLEIRRVIIPPWWTLERTKITKENVHQVLKATSSYLNGVLPEYMEAWNSAIPKEMSFYHEKIMEGACSITEYLEEKAVEMAEYNRNRIKE